MEAVVVICCYICVKYNNTNNNHSLSNINIVVAVSTTMHSSNSNYDNIQQASKSSFVGLKMRALDASISCAPVSWGKYLQSSHMPKQIVWHDCLRVCVCVYAPTLKTESYGLPYPIIINSTTQLSSLQADLYSVNNNKTFKLVLSTINSKY